MARPAPSIVLTAEQQDWLQHQARSREIPHSQVQRAQMILKAAQGESNQAISTELNLHLVKPRPAP